MLIADALVEKMFGNRLCQYSAVLRGNDLQHHVESRDAARAGKTVPVDFKKSGSDLQAREGLGEAWQILPMDGAAITVEQSRAGEKIGALADGADAHAAAGNAAQQCEDHLIIE